jgi:hypothetical protein
LQIKDIVGELKSLASLYFRGVDRVRVRVEPIIFVRQFPHHRKRHRQPKQLTSKKKEERVFCHSEGDVVR